jgi:hypothetical protein
MTYYTVLGCATDIEGALPYMCQPASNTHAAVELWYLTACENIGVNPDAMPPASAEHEALIDAAYSLRRHEQAFLDGEALVLHRFEIGAA